MRCCQWETEWEDVLWGQILFKGRARGSKRSKKEQRNSKAKTRGKATGALWKRRHSWQPFQGPIRWADTHCCWGEHTLEQKKNVTKKHQQRARTVYCLQPPHLCFLLPESIIILFVNLTQIKSPFPMAVICKQILFLSQSMKLFTSVFLTYSLLSHQRGRKNQWTSEWKYCY